MYIWLVKWTNLKAKNFYLFLFNLRKKHDFVYKYVNQIQIQIQMCINIYFALF